MAERDPYRRDPNIERAGGVQVLTGAVLGAGMGWALAGWFEWGSTTIYAIVGAVIGLLFANLLLHGFGGRSTR